MERSFFSPVLPNVRTLCWVAVLNMAFWVALALRCLTVVGWPQAWAFQIYYGVAAMGQGAVVTVGVVLALLPWAFLSRGQSLKWLFIPSCFTTAALVLALLDTVVFSRYHAHLNGLIWQLVWEGGSEVFSIAGVARARLFGLMALLWLVQLGVWVLARNAARRVMLRRTLAPLGLFLGAFVLASLVHAVGDARAVQSVVNSTTALPAYRLMTAKSFFRSRGWLQVQEDGGEAAESRKLDINRQQQGFKLPTTRVTCQPPQKRLNILVLLIDSWRFDLFNGETTPHLKEFFKQDSSSWFTQHFSGGNGTRTGVFSLFYGVVGTYWDAVYAAAVRPWLLHTAAQQAYELSVFSSATLAAPPLDRTVFLNMANQQTSGRGAPAWRRDQAVVDDFLAWLEKRQQEIPFFSTLFFDATHAYDFPADYPHQFLPMTDSEYHLGLANPQLLFNRFKTAVHYVDSQIERALLGLQEHGLLDSTVVIATGDHGEEFDDNQRGYWGHGGNYTRYQIQVPLLVFWPGRKGAPIDHRTTHLDVAPTLLTEVFGCELPVSHYSSGRILWEPGGREWFLSGGYFNYAVVESDHYTAVLPLGNVATYDSRATPLPGRSLDRKVLAAIFGESSRFSP